MPAYLLRRCVNLNVSVSRQTHLMKVPCSSWSVWTFTHSCQWCNRNLIECHSLDEIKVSIHFCRMSGPKWNGYTTFRCWWNLNGIYDECVRPLKTEFMMIVSNLSNYISIIGVCCRHIHVSLHGDVHHTHSNWFEFWMKTTMSMPCHGLMEQLSTLWQFVSQNIEYLRRLCAMRRCGYEIFAH